MNTKPFAPCVVALLSMLFAISARSAGKLPNIVVLATGGTIAGAAGSDVQAAYRSGQVGVDDGIVITHGTDNVG